MPHVMLRKNWNGTFRRRINVGTAKERMLEFQPGEVIEIVGDEIEGVLHDLGKALMPVEWSDEKRKFVEVDMTDVDVEASTVADVGQVGTETSEVKEPETPVATQPEEPETPVVKEPVGAPVATKSKK